MHSVGQYMKCMWHLLSICQPDLRQQITNHITEDEMYVHVKDKLQQQILENKYAGYKLGEDELLAYKNKIYIPSVVDLRRIVMDEIHQAPYSGHPGYQKTIATTRNEKGHCSIYC